MRLLMRSLGLFFLAYGPLAPIALLFLLAMPPLIALSGWPWWIDLMMALGECGLLVGGAVWGGPQVMEEIRAFRVEQRDT
jgi:hypothetical protein